MATRLDELHAHQYSMRRVVQALVSHDPDPTGPTRPRSRTLTLVGAVIAAVIAVATLLYSTLTGQGSPDKLTDSKTVLIEKETGAQYVYTQADEQLHPVLNFASGLLIADGQAASPTTVRRKRLNTLRQESGLAIGTPLGIPGAPNALPGSGDLLADPWQVCTTATGASTTPRTDLLIGASAISGGHVLATPTPGGAAEASLVRGPDQQTYLIFANKKFRLPELAVVLAAFDWTRRQSKPVAAGWLNALPTGSDLAALSIDGAGTRSSVVAQPVGRLLRTTGTGTEQWALVRRDSVLSISPVQALLLRADQRANVGEPVTMSVADFAALRFRTDPTLAQDLPETVPTPVPINSTACVRVADANGANAVVVDPSTTAANAAPPANARSASDNAPPGKATADHVWVPFGHGVLVHASASATAPAGTGTLVLVTDSGVQYPIADHDAQVRLGYGDSTARTMPAALVSLLPVGPALSIPAAQKPAA